MNAGNSMTQGSIVDLKDLDLRIENVVATASLEQKIDLPSIMKVFRNVEYRPRRFPGLVFRMKKPKTATLIFTTGKMVCTGAKSAKMAISAVRKVVRELRKEGFIIKRRPKIKIVNIVGTANVGGKVDLEAAAAIMDNIMYEPEQFPGLIYRIQEPKVVMLIFSSGKTVITGGKTREQVEEAVEIVRGFLRDNQLLYGIENG